MIVYYTVCFLILLFSRFFLCFLAFSRFLDLYVSIFWEDRGKIGFPEFRALREYSHAQPLVSKLPDGSGGECGPDPAMPLACGAGGASCVARPKRAGHALRVLLFLSRVDKKDAALKMVKILVL